MERSWYWRVALIVLVTLFSLWRWSQLVLASCSTDERNNRRALEEAVPGWAPRAATAEPRARPAGRHPPRDGCRRRPRVRSEVERRADEIADFLKEKDVP